MKRAVEAVERTGRPASVENNYDKVRSIVVERVAETRRRITAKRLLPAEMHRVLTDGRRRARTSS